MIQEKKIIHLLPNAHLDPVWLWNWREGYNEAIATTQSMISLMERFPELTFVRGEANYYEPVEKYAPELFEKIRGFIKAGRWDLVGGNYVQTDTNTPSTMTFLEQYRRGRRYFEEKFGVRVETGWAADSAGHTAGLPEILHKSGLRHYAFWRPTENALHLPNPSFLWHGAGGAEILASRLWCCYCHERGNVIERLENFRKEFDHLPQRNLAFYVGLGDHGGGPSARIVEDLLAYAETHKDEVYVHFSTLSGFFKALETERSLLPSVSGELNFVLRGVHFANAPIKHRFRDLEARYKRTGRVCSVVNNALKHPAPDFDSIRDALLFNTFHDILPGDGIESADRDQLAWMDGALHRLNELEYDALNRLAVSLDMPVPPPFAYDEPGFVPHLIFNPSVRPFKGYVNIESQLDYRPLYEFAGQTDPKPGFAVFDEQGKRLAAQEVDTEHLFFKKVPWRLGMLLPLEIPPLGYRRLAIGKAADRLECPPSPVMASGNSITNGKLKVEIANDRIHISCDGKTVGAADGIRFAVFRDRFGCWGGMGEEPESWTCPELLETWRAGNVKILENGPERAMLFVRFSGGHSSLDIRISLTRDGVSVDFDALLLWQERDMRLRMLFDPVKETLYQIPGGQIKRSEFGDVPGGRWIQTAGFGLASDHFSGFCSLPEYFCVNMVKGCVHCTDEEDAASRFPERPVIDLGKHRFRFALTCNPGDAVELAERIELPPESLMSYPHSGREIATSFVVQPSCVQVHLLEQNENGLKAMVQNCSDTPVDASVGGKLIYLEPWKIVEMMLP